MAAQQSLPGRLIGYSRVSTEEQTNDPQLDVLRQAGCSQVFQEKASGASRSRPQLAKLMAEVRAGDIVVVARLDRLARSVSHLLEVIEHLQALKVHFRSLGDPIDTSTPQGMFTAQVLGAVAQLERALISERTKAGMKAARARGRMPGNPGLRAREPQAIRRNSSARRAGHTAALISSIDSWMPVVRRMRPDMAWDDVARALNNQGRYCGGKPWTTERLRRSVTRLVGEGLVDARYLASAPRRASDDRLMILVAGIRIANPNLELRQIGAQLQSMHERTPRGGTRWAASSVKSLLDRAIASGVYQRLLGSQRADGGHDVVP